MSRETLLDEAIAKAKEAEDWQLVEWLRMARGGESAARWYTAKLGEARLDMSKLMTENAKLREMVRFVLVLRHDPVYKWLDATTAEVCGKSFTEQARELGMEMDE